jgi:hypothetical protein
MMKYIYSLLSQEQVFGENKIDVISAAGVECSASDFAAAAGADISSEGKCSWFLSSSSGYGDVCKAAQDGSRQMAYSSSRGGMRPVINIKDIQQEAGGAAKDSSGLDEYEFGEYPQRAAGKKQAGLLEQQFTEARLIKTGKKFDSVYDEYQYDGRKYIRVIYSLDDPVKMSDGKTYKNGEPVWIEVLPVKWLYDSKTGLMISKTVLLSGLVFSSEAFYDGDFEKTDICRYLNTTFAEDIMPSALYEMTPEEKKEYEADIRRTARRRNPYGFTFGEVSEEDIIRGAIESDVPVFLHGPSSEGKSARVKQIDPTCELIYLRNATPDSLNGRSVYNQATGEMIDIPPVWYRKLKEKCEREPEKLHVVFFDEINNALPSIQGMAFNIVLDREVNGTWKLPDNARVVAAGNDMQDSLAAHQLAAPFFNRFAHVYINTTTKKWLRWARENNIHPAIYAYIAYRNGETLRSEYTGEKPNADPRKWEMASKMLYATGCPEMLRALIGEEITDEFVRFCNQAVITVEDVLNGDYSEREIANMNTSERYATAVGLTQARDSEIAAVRDFVSKLGEEFRALFDSFTADSAAVAGVSPSGKQPEER